MTPIKVVIIGLLTVIAVEGCGRSRLSDREVRREQIRLNAETKKRELASIKGDYDGAMDSGAIKSKQVSLHLDVVEAPFNDNGGIDPVMMPQLSGFLRIYSGSDAFDSLNIVRGEYDPKRAVLELVVKDDRLGEMQLSLAAAMQGFTGEWQAAALSLTGTMKLSRSGLAIGDGTGQGGGEALPPPDGNQDQISGSYIGYADDDARGAHYAASFQVRATSVPGQGMKYSVDVRLSRGLDSTEFSVWKFDNPEFNPLTRKMTLRKEGVNENFILTLNQGAISGEWTSAVYGRMGAVAASKDSSFRSSLPRATARTGAHDVCLKNFGEANLPEHGALTMTVTPDVSSDGKVRTQASMVFYLGAYNAPERITCTLEQVDLDYISGRFQGVCRSLPDTGPMIISGSFNSLGFDGRLTASGANGADIKAGRCQEASP
jgi:hypothetical protein